MKGLLKKIPDKTDNKCINCYLRSSEICLQVDCTGVHFECETVNRDVRRKCSNALN